MQKRTWFALSVSTLAVALALPLMADTFTVKANIPFQFTVGDKVLPAGEYMVKSEGINPTLTIQDETANAAALTLVQRKYLVTTDHSSDLTKLTFNRYGDRYFLSEVDNGYTGTGFILPQSSTERELARTASLRPDQTVTVIAQR